MLRVDRLDRTVEKVTAAKDKAKGGGRRLAPRRCETHAGNLVEMKLQRPGERGRTPGERLAVASLAGGRWQQLAR